MLDGPQVAGGTFDAEPEQVADAAHVATGGVDLVRDAVLAQRPRTQGDVALGEAVADGHQPWRGAPADQQVGIEAARPATVAVVEPGRQPGPDRCRQRDLGITDGELAVDDVGQQDLSQLLAGQRVERDEGRRRVRLPGRDG